MHRPTLSRVCALAVAAAAALGLLHAATASAGISPILGGGIVIGPGSVFKLPSPPAFPGLYDLQAMPLAVTVHWYDRSSDEQKFVLYRRDSHGAWQELYEVPTRDVAGSGEDYTYVDTDRSISGQCYIVAAVNQNGSGYASEQCTVRPDPSRFPQNPPSAVQQWAGLSSTNDGTGDLQTTTRESYTSLTWSHETFGVDLDWTENGALWKVEAQGGPNLMRGQAVALRVWGGGWLKYGNQTWGVDLQLSDTPSYEWYVLGGTPGSPILDGAPFALWNSAAHDYLVYGDETWGVNLNWYQKTLPPPPPPPPPPPTGVKAFQAYNCVDEQRPVEMWVVDLTAGSGWVDNGQLGSQYTGAGCGPGTGTTPWTFTPTSGHQYLVESVDFLAPGCANDPTIADCWRSQTTFVGDANGQVVYILIGG